MTKAKNAIASAIPSTTVEPLIEISSFKNAAYQSALNGERLETIARYCIDNCATFLDKGGISDEIKSELREGFALRWQEKHEPVLYSDDWTPNPKGLNLATLNYALSYSQQSFGAIDQPLKKAVLKDIRDDFNNYVSNRIGDIKRAIRALDKTSKPKDPIPDFIDYLNDKEKGVWSSVKARRKTAEQRGDATVPTSVKLQNAIDAFNNALI